MEIVQRRLVEQHIYWVRLKSDNGQATQSKLTGFSTLNWNLDVGGSQKKIRERKGHVMRIRWDPISRIDLMVVVAVPPHVGFPSESSGCPFPRKFKQWRLTLSEKTILWIMGGKKYYRNTRKTGFSLLESLPEATSSILLKILFFSAKFCVVARKFRRTAYALRYVKEKKKPFTLSV